MDKLGKKILDVPFEDKPSHQLYLCCSDGRFRENHRLLLPQIQFESANKIAWPGGCSAFCRRSQLHDSFVEAVKFFRDHIGIREAVQDHHMTCKFLAVEMKGKSLQEILDQQRKDSQEIQELLYKLITPTPWMQAVYEKIYQTESGELRVETDELTF